MFIFLIALDLHQMCPEMGDFHALIKRFVLTPQKSPKKSPNEKSPKLNA